MGLWLNMVKLVDPFDWTELIALLSLRPYVVLTATVWNVRLIATYLSGLMMPLVRAW